MGNLKGHGMRKRNKLNYWKLYPKETMVMSSPTQMAETKSYKKIESLGKEVVPFLIESLGREPGCRSYRDLGLLHRLTGETPFTPDKRGHIDEMIAAWKSWGKPKEYKGRSRPDYTGIGQETEKKIAKPIPHEDIGDPNQKGFALRRRTELNETMTQIKSSSTDIHDYSFS